MTCNIRVVSLSGAWHSIARKLLINTHMTHIMSPTCRQGHFGLTMLVPSSTWFGGMSVTCWLTCCQHVGPTIICLSFGPFFDISESDIPAKCTSTILCTSPDGGESWISWRPLNAAIGQAFAPITSIGHAHPCFLWYISLSNCPKRAQVDM